MNSPAEDILAHTRNLALIWRFHVKLDTETIEPFLKVYPPEEVVRRLDRLEVWLARYHMTNHDGTILTPPLLDFLLQDADFESLLSQLDRLREQTRQGNFKLDNVLQRDLEFRRFAYEYTRVLEPLTYVLRQRYPPPMSHEELYTLFEGLEELPPAAPAKEFELNAEQLREVGRTAWEAAGFLRFLKGFRASTSRPIVVVGDDRFGRMWIVEPIEKYLEEGFTVRYDRARSGTTTRLSVPHAFPRRFVSDINRSMPHVVITDGASAPPQLNLMKHSRSLQSYAHWFAVFNDLRAQGNVSSYQHESSLPENHVPELMRWHEYVALKEWMAEWVTPGPTYRVTTWAPELKDTVRLGYHTVARDKHEIAGDRPLVVLANPIVYRTEGDDLPQVLQGTTPRYFDDPEAHVEDKVEFGFGPYGLQTRRKGFGTDAFVRAVQRHMETQIEELMRTG